MKKSDYLHIDCLPMLMLLYIMLVYLMPLTALFNAACFIMTVYFCFFILPMTFALLLSAQMLFFMLCLSIINTVCLLQLLFSIMYTAFNQLVLLI